MFPAVFYQLGTRLRRLGSMFSTNLREALSVSSSARMMPQASSRAKNATFLWENCAKIWVHLSTSLGFFPVSSSKFYFAAGNCEPLAVSRRTTSVLRIFNRIT